jgi:hypothetical protein
VDDIDHGEVDHGEVDHGGVFTNIVANFIDEDQDRSFEVGSNLKFTFFIGGYPLGVNAGVPTERKDEFRQLILRLKQTQNVAFLFIDYV